MTLHVDFETRSIVELPKTGVYPYARHRHTDIWCMAYAFDDGPVALWRMGDPPPADVVEWVEGGGSMTAHNAQFERIMWRDVLAPRYGFPTPTLRQWHCTAAMAAAMALPRGLGHVSSVMGLEVQKDEKGHRLMLQMCRPRKKDKKGNPLSWWDDEERLERLYAYCITDVETERALERSLRPLSDAEQELYWLDQEINDRGVRIDLPLVRAAQELSEESLKRATEALIELSNGSVPTINSIAKFRQWMARHGIETDSLDKAAVTNLLEEDLPAVVEKALVLRSEAGRSSVAKLVTMENAAGEGDRARGLLVYHGAATGRWSGSLVQPQNMPRGTVDDIESWIGPVLERDYDKIDLFHPPAEVISSMLRSMITAEPGSVLMAGDFSAIEARVLNWLAGEQRVLEDFRLYDEGDKAHDPYVRNAMRLYGLPFEQIEKFPHRQSGKFQELGCGFGMGAQKAEDAARDIYGLTLSPEEAKQAVDAYRESHPNVVQYWYDLSNAAMEAVQEPGTNVGVGEGPRRVVFSKRGPVLWLKLPSGRLLSYPQPRIEMRDMPWSTEEKVDRRPAVIAGSVNSVSKKWERRALYGGLLAENVTQAVARDVMADAMRRINPEFPVVLTVHDEVVSEAPEADADLDTFTALLAEVPSWAQGLPVAVECWQGFRYRK